MLFLRQAVTNTRHTDSAYHVTSGEQALWLLLPVDSVLLVTHTHTGCCCDFVAVLNDRDLSGVVVMPTGRVKYGLCH